jgi:hypothetical protein
MFNIDDDKVRRIRIVPAYLVEWVDNQGRVIRTQVSSEYPMTEVQRGKESQRLVAKVLGHTYQDALDRLMRMVEAVNPKLAASLRSGKGMFNA